MKQTTCTYCKEEIREDAIRCRHCYSDLVTTFEQQATAVILGRHYISHEPSLIKPSGSACDALCYHKFGSDKVRLNECLDNCKAISAMKYLLDMLHREIDLTLIDIIWGGGDIDPLPLEREIRERFARDLPQP